jgi:hypothetical protein
MGLACSEISRLLRSDVSILPAGTVSAFRNRLVLVWLVAFDTYTCICHLMQFFVKKQIMCIIYIIITLYIFVFLVYSVGIELQQYAYSSHCY